MLSHGPVTFSSSSEVQVSWNFCTINLAMARDAQGVYPPGTFHTTGDKPNAGMEPHVKPSSATELQPESHYALSNSSNTSQMLEDAPSVEGRRSQVAETGYTAGSHVVGGLLTTCNCSYMHTHKTLIHIN